MIANKAVLERLKGYRFRRSSTYLLIPLNEVSHTLKKSDEVDNESLFGILKDRESGAYRLVDCDTALLLYTLEEPNYLPYHVLKMVDDAMFSDILFMLSINILEIEVEEGKYLGGAEALEVLKKRTSLPVDSINREAMLHAYAHLPTDHATLTGVLYSFNHKPVTKRLKEKLFNKESVKAFFGLDVSSEESRFFYRHWQAIRGNQGWIAFVRHTRFGEDINKSSQTYKLYLSPSKLEKFQEIFFTLSTLLHEAGAFQFKIGADAYGLQRPDKWVAYFYDKTSLYRAMELIEREVGEVEAQEVPFSGESMLSWLGWGSDPKSNEKERVSWRWFLCSEIAHAMLDAKREGLISGDRLWDYIAVRLEREHIDPVAFEPI